MQVTEQTKEMAQRIVDFIMVNPDKHKQAAWVGKWDEAMEMTMDVDKRLNKNNVCDTTMCIAGTAVFLDQGITGLNKHIKNTDTNHSWEDSGGKLLGLEGHEVDMLFYEMDDDKAVDMVRAITSGDEDKFYDIANNA